MSVSIPYNPAARLASNFNSGQCDVHSDNNNNNNNNNNILLLLLLLLLLSEWTSHCPELKLDASLAAGL